MEWEVIRTSSLSAQCIMDKDAYLLAQLEFTRQPILHFYEWEKPSLTYGYFTNPHVHLNTDVELKELQMARRPTGGGIIFHLSDLAFSILLPSNHPKISLNTLENYALINEKVAEAVVNFSQSNLETTLHSIKTTLPGKIEPFCMAKPTIYDILIKGKKVGGAAQRRTKSGLLHQASLSLQFPSKSFLSKILKNPKVIEEMDASSFNLLTKDICHEELIFERERLREFLIQKVTSL